jgi:hypothetical protein
MSRWPLIVLIMCSAAIGCVDRSVPQAETTQPGSDATLSAEGDPCVARCLEERKMEAMDWDVITAQCEASCESSSSARP